MVAGDICESVSLVTIRSEGARRVVSLGCVVLWLFLEFESWEPTLAALNSLSPRPCVPTAIILLRCGSEKLLF